MIIAIDGTASSGKSTLSRALGKALGINVLGTGSLYRAITLKIINLNIDVNDDDRIAEMLDNTILESRFNNDTTSIVLDGIVQSYSQLNSEEVSNLCPQISCKEYVRVFVRRIQKHEAEKHHNIIVEGRDIGSVVFPEAEIKLFIDADIKTRAKRRQLDLYKSGVKVKYEDVLNDLIARDEADRKREISPLLMTSDSIIIDTSSMSVKESVNQIIKILADKKLNLS